MAEASLIFGEKDLVNDLNKKIVMDFFTIQLPVLYKKFSYTRANYQIYLDFTGTDGV